MIQFYINILKVKQKMYKMYKNFTICFIVTKFCVLVSLIICCVWLFLKNKVKLIVVVCTEL